MNDEQSAVLLLVEDDPDHAELVSRALAGQNAVRLVHVTDGRSALDYLARKGPWVNPETSPRPDLVLLDLRLPGMGGEEVLHLIKTDEALRPIPVVILSTSEVRGDVADGEADACAVKPVDGSRFRAMVRELVETWITGAARRPGEPA